MLARADRLREACRVLPTWVQSCFFATDGAPPPAHEVDAYVELLTKLQLERLPYFRGVLLYGLARPSLQPEAKQLSVLPQTWFEQLVSRLAAVGVTADIYL